LLHHSRTDKSVRLNNDRENRALCEIRL